MSEYLQKINQEYSNKEFNDWYIDNIFAFPHNSSDLIENIINKYFKSIYEHTNFKIENEEANIVLNELKNEYNILIKSFLNFLLACSYKRDISTLVDNCSELVNLYFDNIDKIDGGLPIHNLATVLKWSTYKFPKESKTVVKKIYDGIINGNIKKIRYFSMAEFFVREKDLMNLFTANEYAAIFDKYFVEKANDEYVYLYLDFYNSYIKYLENNDKSRRKSFLKKYCDFVINNIDLFDCHTKCRILPKARDYMDDLDYDSSDYLTVDENIKSAIDEISKSMEQHNIDIPKNLKNEFFSNIEKQNEIYKSLSNKDKIDKLMFDLSPIKSDDAKKEVESQKSGLAAIFDESVIINDKMIYYKDLDRDEEFTLRATTTFQLRIGIYFDISINPFVNSFKFDDDSKKYISQILKNNPLVAEEKAENLIAYFNDFFDNDYRHSVYDIVEEFEESLRYYFKQCGLNIVKKNGKHDFIGIGDIFNNHKKNEFRDKLYETIDEDFYFTLKWLLADKYGFELRNKIAHRYSHPDLFKTTFAIFSVFQIFRLYWGFQN